MHEEIVELIVLLTSIPVHSLLWEALGILSVSECSEMGYAPLLLTATESTST